MANIITKNAEYSSKLKSILGLRYEPVAVKLVHSEGEYPESCAEPEEQISHCQAVFRAKDGACLKMPAEKHSCHVGASAMNIIATPPKVASGEFHAGIGMHNSADAAKKMISDRIIPERSSVGEAVCPLSKADFEPDVVVIADIPERIYWIISSTTADKGGRENFSTSPFQCVCEDVVSVPMVTGSVNLSLGCYGCRRRTDMKAEEMVCGIPYSKLPAYVEQIEKYVPGPMSKAKRT